MKRSVGLLSWQCSPECKGNAWWPGPAGGDKRPKLWPSSTPSWGTLRALILLCQPLSTPAHYTTSWEISGVLVYTSAQKWDNTFVECEITTMHCGNITQGLRKEEDCSLEIRASQCASWQCWKPMAIFFFQAFLEKVVMVHCGVSRNTFKLCMLKVFTTKH